MTSAKRNPEHAAVRSKAAAFLAPIADATDGAYAVEMASVERVRVGDEICWDYRCRTDSEREMRAALCLCGSRRCRVSYLHFAGHDDASCVLKKKGTVAHFTAALLRACGPCGDGRARTLEEIGTVFRITRERVRQIEARALHKLRQPYRNHLLEAYTTGGQP